MGPVEAAIRAQVALREKRPQKAVETEEDSAVCTKIDRLGTRIIEKNFYSRITSKRSPLVPSELITRKIPGIILDPEQKQVQRNSYRAEDY